MFNIKFVFTLFPCGTCIQSVLKNKWLSSFEKEKKNPYLPTLLFKAFN